MSRLQNGGQVCERREEGGEKEYKKKEKKKTFITKSSRSSQYQLCGQVVITDTRILYLLSTSNKRRGEGRLSPGGPTDVHFDS